MARALELRVAGQTFGQIAKVLGCSSEVARAVVVRATSDLEAEIEENVQRLRALELRRLDDIQAALWADRSDPGTAKTLLSVLERRARMLGLDEPQKVVIAALSAPERVRQIEGLIELARERADRVEAGSSEVIDASAEELGSSVDADIDPDR